MDTTLNRIGIETFNSGNSYISLATVSIHLLTKINILLVAVPGLYPVKVKIETMEKYSEAKTCKSKPVRNIKMLTSFIHRSGNNNYCQLNGVCS